MTVSINMTQIAILALRSGALTKECNKVRQVYDVFHNFYTACYLHMHNEWKRRGLSIADFGYLKKDLEALAVKKPGTLRKALAAWDEKGAGGGAAGAAGGGDFVSFD